MTSMMLIVWLKLNQSCSNTENPIWMHSINIAYVYVMNMIF